MPPIASLLSCLLERNLRSSGCTCISTWYPCFYFWDIHVSTFGEGSVAASHLLRRWLQYRPAWYLCVRAPSVCVRVHVCVSVLTRPIYVYLWVSFVLMCMSVSQYWTAPSVCVCMWACAYVRRCIRVCTCMCVYVYVCENQMREAASMYKHSHSHSHSLTDSLTHT